MLVVIQWLLLLNIKWEMLLTLLGNMEALKFVWFFYHEAFPDSFFYYHPCRLLSIAEETLTEFLSKATGTAVDWVQMPGMKVSH